MFGIETFLNQVTHLHKVLYELIVSVLWAVVSDNFRDWNLEKSELSKMWMDQICFSQWTFCNMTVF